MRISAKIVHVLGLALMVGSPVGLTAQVQPADPGLQPGDVVEVTVWQRAELSGQFTVNIDGTLVHPLYRQVRVTGLGAQEVEERLRAFLSAYEASPMVVVRPLYQVTVAGHVMRPDIYSVPAGTTVNAAVVQAGGVTESGKMDDVRITRDGNTMEVDLRQPTAVRMLVQSGDQILVQARSTAGVGVVRSTILPLFQMGLMIANIVTIANR
ncbi:MAG TPA: polysaccharide biosynthesis/export family protein [Longimicrobiales bacterium]|nr:polysaccharide biosynthesis/export family protein [Longimicrobiales bacterium]